ncbi:hypothetical protein PIROE2DRAFT_57062 [Piromyces sp. E2]|nr:hypothetical protein PIROE2DRAFT_57062 [Piromyces sp. E2]|eukprot:OUM69991.1 hypothetical protein PIROE2DRAFT_57062 [Piromyces sp. E2]
MKSLVYTILTLFAVVFVNASNINTYESLGIDAIQKQKAEEKLASDLLFPVINISTRNNTELIIHSDYYIDCVVDVFNVKEDALSMTEASGQVKVRGNSSAFFGDPEKAKTDMVPYRVKFTKKENILGLHSGEEFKNWVFIKQDYDIIRNDIALRMGRAIAQNKYYVSDSSLVNLFVNDVFKGIYMVAEQNQVHEKRVNVTIPEKNYNGTDIGYYLELDSYYEKEKYYFPVDYEEATVKDIMGEERQFIQHHYTIKSDIYSQDQVDFIAHYFRNVFKIVYLAVEKGEYKTFDENYHLVNATYTNAQDTISLVLDIESVVDMYILYELVHDYDVGWGSFFFAIDFAENSQMRKLQMTSPWDFNWAYEGSTDRYWAGAFSEMSFILEFGHDRSNPWFIELVKENWFHELVN